MARLYMTKHTLMQHTASNMSMTTGAFQKVHLSKICPISSTKVFLLVRRSSSFWQRAVLHLLKKGRPPRQRSVACTAWATAMGWTATGADILCNTGVATLSEATVSVYLAPGTAWVTAEDSDMEMAM